MMNWIIQLIESLYYFLWGDWIQFEIFSVSLALPLLVLILIPSGLFFTWKTRFLPVRLFKQMLSAALKKKEGSDEQAISGVQALIISTATRVGMGNLVGVVAAISLGGAGAVFWMWVTALLGASTAFIEATLASMFRQKDPLYGGFRGGPAHYLHALYSRKNRRPILAVLFALSALLCFGGISQVISNSVSGAFENAFNIPPIVSTLTLVIVAALIVFSKSGTVKALDVLVPFMAGAFLLVTIWVIAANITLLPSVFASIFREAFGIEQMAAGGFGAVLMNGVKRGLFSNEAGSGSAPCAAAAADCSHPVQMGLISSLGVLIDTIVICTCTAMLMLLTPEGIRGSLEGMDLLQASMHYHLGPHGVSFIALILWLFSLSTFIGIFFYARSNVAYLFGDSPLAQQAYKIFALVMLFIGGISAYTVVWDLGDIGIGLMTIFNMCALIPLSAKAIKALREYEMLKTV